MDGHNAASRRLANLCYLLALVITRAYLVSDFENHHLSGISNVFMHIHKWVQVSSRSTTSGFVVSSAGLFRALCHASLALVASFLTRWHGSGELAETP